MYERSATSSDANQISIAHGSDPEGAKISERRTNSHVERQNLNRARREVAILREGLFRRRIWLKEKRNALQQERTNVAEIEADLTTFIWRNFSERIVSEPSLARKLYAELESKRDALEAKRDELGALQYDYDQAEIDYNLKETEFDEEEQIFESLMSEVMGLSNLSEDDASSASSNDELQQERSETPPTPVFDPNRAQFLTSRLRTRSDSALATIQQSFPKARPRINWWILHTFGSSPIDYVQRARDKALVQDLSDVTLDDETWARLVFEYWQREKEPEQTSDRSNGSWAEVSTQELPEPRHIRRLTVGGSYLLLSSELSKAQYTVDNYDLLFPADPGFRHNFILQDDSVSKDLNFLSNQEGRSFSHVSAPATLNSLDFPA